jgi:MFS family permease
MTSAPSQDRAAPAAKLSHTGARASLALLLAINLFNYIDRQVLAAVEPNISAEFFPGGGERADLWMGLLPPAFMVSYMLTAPVFGWLADRTRRWVLIGIGVILWSLASGGSGLAPTIGALLVTRMLVGVGEGAYGPAAPAIISDLYPVKKRGAKLAWFYVAIPVGSALGYVLGGTVARLMHDWRWAFYIVVPPGLLLGALCFAMREPGRGLSDKVASARMLRLADFRQLLRTPSYVLNTLGMTAMTFAVGGMGFWMPRYVAIFRMNADPNTEAGRRVLEAVNFRFGLLIVASGLTATLAGGWLGDKLKPRLPGSYFLISGLGMLLGFPLTLGFMFTPFPLAWVFIFLAAFCLFFNTGPTNTILANVTHPSMRSSAFALNILIIHLCGDAASPFLMPLVKTVLGGSWNTAFGLVAMAFLVGGVLWIWGARYLERDTALAPTRLA